MKNKDDMEEIRMDIIRRIEEGGKKRKKAYDIIRQIADSSETIWDFRTALEELVISRQYRKEGLEQAEHIVIEGYLHKTFYQPSFYHKQEMEAEKNDFEK